MLNNGVFIVNWEFGLFYFVWCVCIDILKWDIILERVDKIYRKLIKS